MSWAVSVKGYPYSTSKECYACGARLDEQVPRITVWLAGGIVARLCVSCAEELVRETAKAVKSVKAVKP